MRTVSSTRGGDEALFLKRILVALPSHGRAWILVHSLQLLRLIMKNHDLGDQKAILPQVEGRLGQSGFFISTIVSTPLLLLQL